MATFCYRDNQMKLFISYSRRDGLVTTELLKSLENYLQEICTPFIHCLHASSTRWQQAIVLHELLRSHAILLIESPATRNSEWVQLELFIARLLRRPLLHIQATELIAINEANKDITLHLTPHTARDTTVSPLPAPPRC